MTVYAAPREGPQRRGFVHLDGDGERTITILGDRIVPHGDDDLPWERLDGVDAVYFTGGDDGRAAPGAPRAQARRHAARATTRCAAAGIQLDALVRSAKDPGEQQAEEELDPAPDLRRLDGRQGGRRVGGRGPHAQPWKAAELPGPRRDAYGAGDSFAAGLTYALGAGMRTGRRGAARRPLRRAQADRPRRLRRPAHRG